MKITVLDTLEIEKLPSGSGITTFGEKYYIIGDDSPFLFILNKEFETVSKTPLIGHDGLSDKRIIKSKKPDFEAMEMVDKNEIAIFGSGSKSPERDIFMRIFVKDSITTERYVISDFYEHLKKLPLFSDTELNIEAAAFYHNQIFLFNRKKNLLIKFNYKKLLAYFKKESPFPTPEITLFSLPKIKGVEAGFSGATVLKGESKIIFTASVENTDNAYDDGEILGSFIGVIDISTHKIIDYCQIPNTEKKLKVESVTIDQEISPEKTKVTLITDDDKGNSILIKSLLLW